VHLSRAGASVEMFAPDIDMPAVNHLKQQPEPHSRNVLVESARIARGKIRPLAQLKAGEFDAVVFPGGFGAAKNLSDFATKGAACTVNADAERVIKEFHEARKPVGLCCIAPVLAAKTLGKAKGGPGVTVTLGNDKGVADAVASMGSTHVEKPVTAAVTDERQQVVTTPAYMYGESPVHQVYEGIGAMIAGVLARVK
jgi:enhancing lycopene biosynthesis protein 2